MGRLTSILLTIALLATAAHGQGAAERPQAAQAALIDRISTTRLALERIDDATALVSAQRDEAARKHEALAAEIGRIKDARKRAGLLPDFTLQRKLRQSQELAESLTLLNRELEALSQARRDRLQQLALDYDALIQQAAARAKDTSGQRRADLVALLEQARRELAIVQQQLSPTPQAPRDLDGAELLASDDPEELLERADAVKDEQDRLRKQLAQLDTRRTQLRRAARLDREMRDFISEQEIFDEGSRVLVVPRGPAATSGPQGKADENAADPGRTDNFEGDSDAPPDDGADPAYNDGALSGGEAPTGAAEPDPTGFGAATSPSRLPEGVGREDAPAGEPEAGDDLQSIDQRREQIVERLKGLQRLHDSLLEKIEDLERE